MTKVEAVWPDGTGVRENTLAMAGMVAEEGRLRAEGRWTSAPRQHMDVLGLDHAEVPNCALLAWALDPLGRHGIGAAVLADLATTLKLDPSGVARASVRCEVVCHTSRADVVISVPDAWTLVIEAKVHSREEETQGARLETDWPRPATLVFLTPTGRAPTTAGKRDRWTAMSWAWFSSAIERHLGAGTLSPVEEARMSVRLWSVSAGRAL